MSTRSSILYCQESDEHWYYEMMDDTIHLEINSKIHNVSICNGIITVELIKNTELYKEFSNFLRLKKLVKEEIIMPNINDLKEVSEN